MSAVDSFLPFRGASEWVLSVLGVGILGVVWLLNWDGVTTYFEYFFTGYAVDPSPGGGALVVLALLIGGYLGLVRTIASKTSNRDYR